MEAQFILATRSKLRFETPRGHLTVEDLWDLPLSSTAAKPNLDDIAKSLYRELKNSDDGLSFVTPATKADTSLQLKFDIVKQVIAVKIVERDEATAAAAKRVQKQRIMELIERKQDDSLAAKSIDELRAELEKL